MNDKKKLIIVIALAVVVLGIGAFQFSQMSSGEAKPQATAKREPKPDPESTTEDTVSAAMQDLIKVGMGGPRDPFTPSELEALPGMTPPPTQQTPTPVPPTRRPRSGVNPGGFEGQVPPWQPLPGPGQGAPGPSGTNVTPIADPNAFNYTVTGVITGAKPAAVFTDANGNQRLVALGGSPGEGSQLVAVERGRVTVRHKGKTLTFNVGGTPNAN